MENLLPYILKASALLAVFFLAYHTLLKKETFFGTNRLFLIAGLITSALLPLAEYTKVIFVDPIPARPFTSQELTMMNTAMLQEQKIPEPAFEINWFYVALGVYAIGLAFFGIRLLADVFKIRKMLAGKRVTKSETYKLVDSADVDSPFSFFNYIVYNSGVLQPQELDSILTHEKVHSRQKHSVDMLLAQTFCIVFWFNPIVWLYKKAISQNLEFIADSEATKLVADVKAYQKTMLRLSIEPQYISITNQFYQSLIKKRIVMLNKQKSRRRNFWKYAIVLPALTAFVLAFQVKVVAQEKQLPVQPKISERIKMSIEITKDSKDEELQAEKDIFKEEFDTDVTISNIKRNSKKEITGIRVAVKAKDQDKVYEVNGTDPITAFTIEVEKDDTGLLKIVFGSHVSKKLTGVTYAKAEAISNAVAADSTYSISTSSRTYTDSPKNGGAVRTVSKPTEINMGDVLIVLNGKKLPKGEVLKLPAGEEVEGMTVLKNKEAKKKYGKDAKEGVIEITTRRTVSARGFAMLPRTQAYAYTSEPTSISTPTIRQRVVIGSYVNDDVKAYEEMTDDQYLLIKDSDEAYSDLTLDELKKELATTRSAGIFTTATANGYDNRPQQISERAAAKLQKESAYKLSFFTEKMKMEMEKSRQEMDDARKEMKKIRAEMEAERAKYKAERKKAQKAQK
ncbi:M56 family metallopeptidase [Flavobacterium psychrotrophum]|uniref:M56 family metallopeptidase n=1 Tax=Flavobacterium psychrotrophum TaxID=2294119 RepID=UPI000E30ED06|nr:M56 family metallopeptidase [Flavobacterium psychrotrophum]